MNKLTTPRSWWKRNSDFSKEGVPYRRTPNAAQQCGRRPCPPVRFPAWRLAMATQTKRTPWPVALPPASILFASLPPLRSGRSARPRRPGEREAAAATTCEPFPSSSPPPLHPTLELAYSANSPIPFPPPQPVHRNPIQLDLWRQPMWSP